MKPKMIGPTTHVVSQSPIASALWHPYGVDGSCLVTLTEDAVIRLWEINFNDSWSFDSPSLDVDLQKLASGSSEKEDFRPNKLNRRRGFSVDGIGMNVASACFGGTGSSEESPWSAMTLWIAMKEGDIYALCPLLPGHWQPSSTTLASLSASAMSKQASMQEKSLSPEELQQYEDQYKWISDIDGQDPRFVSGKDQFSLETEIYTRPSRPSVPRLQGPFQLLAEDDVDLDLTDIHVIAAKIDGEELMYGEEPDSDSGLGMDDEGGLSASIICLATKSGRVYLCVDLVGVEGQWLPRSKVSHQETAYVKLVLIMSISLQQSHPTQPAEEFYLTTIEIVDTLTPEAALETEWPTFSIDEGSRYSFFLTHSQGVFFFSLDPWVQSLESELQSPASVGTAFRVDVLANSCGTLRERILDFRRDQRRHGGTAVAAITLQDSDMGYFLLTAVDDVPIAAVLDTPDSSPNNGFDLVTTDDLAQGMDMLALRPTRSPYIPPSSLWERSTLPTFLDSQVQNRHKKALKEEIRLSSATLDLMTHAHRVLSQETHALGVAAADLFRRCERLQDEIRDQISRVKETANRIDQAIDDDDDQKKEIDESDVKGHVESRLENVRARQEKLLARFNRTKSQFAQCQGKDLSENEQCWISDTQKLQKSLIPADEEAQPNDEQVLEPWQRLEEVRGGIRITYLLHLLCTGETIGPRLNCSRKGDFERRADTDRDLQNPSGITKGESRTGHEISGKRVSRSGQPSLNRQSRIKR